MGHLEKNSLKKTVQCLSATICKLGMNNDDALKEDDRYLFSGRKIKGVFFFCLLKLGRKIACCFFFCFHENYKKGLMKEKKIIKKTIYE